jgi:hypothetical protein
MHNMFQAPEVETIMKSFCFFGVFMTKPGIAGRPAAVLTDRNIWQRWSIRVETIAS